MFMMIAVVLFLHFIFPNLISRISTAIASPFWSLETGIRSNYLETNSILENAIISNLNKENEELKNILGRKASSSPMILGGIIKKPPFTAYDVYIVDVGGSVVRVGNKVYVKGGVLVGEVVEVNGRYVKVKLYSSYGEKYDVLIGKSSIQATATGQGGGSFEVILPRESNVFINDEVLIPNLSPSVFGIVKSIDIESAGTFSVILFSQPINIYEQKWVQIDNLD
jgi:cell shape-determining protein MreC